MSEWNANETQRATIKTPYGDFGVDAGASFTSEVVRVANESGMARFRVYLGGVEVDKDTAPETILAGQVIELKSEDKAGA